MLAGSKLEAEGLGEGLPAPFLQGIVDAVPEKDPCRWLISSAQGFAEGLDVGHYAFLLPLDNQLALLSMSHQEVICNEFKGLGHLLHGEYPCAPSHT